VIASSGWFAASPSGTESIYEIYAERFKKRANLDAILREAQQIGSRAFGGDIMRGSEFLRYLGESLCRENTGRDLIDDGTFKHYVDQPSVTRLTSTRQSSTTRPHSNGDFRRFSASQALALPAKNLIRQHRKIKGDSA
jgi:hypothetical protein